MARDLTATKPWGWGDGWGTYSSVSELPNVSGAAEQSAHLNAGDHAVVAGELYICTNASPGGGAWALMQRASGTTALTTTRVPYVTTGGVLKDEAAFTYTEGSDLLTVANVTASGTIQAEQLTTTDDLTVQGLATISETLTVTGDIAASGGFRSFLNGFAAPGAAGVAAADQTNLDLRFVHTLTTASSFIAPRPGSIVGLSAQLSAAITTAGSAMTLDVKATVNGTEVALVVPFTTGGAEVKGYAVAAKDTLAFAAGDVLGISYTSTTISNTPALSASLEIES